MKELIKQIQLIRRVSYKFFLALLLISGVITVIALRNNNQTMIELRNGVYAADELDGDVASALNRLRTYVHGHMNTDLSSGNNAIKPPIQLKHTYERLVIESQKTANKSQLYIEAANYCQAKIPAAVSGRARVPCVEEYIMSHGGKTPTIIAPGLYQFDFVSPVWSPDLAGWSLVGTIILFIATAVSFLRQRFTH